MKKTRLLFELAFIFVLPIVFLLFFVRLDTTYVYDNSGNYQASSRELSLAEINFVNGVKNIQHGIEYVYYSQDEFNQLDQSVLSNFRFAYLTNDARYNPFATVDYNGSTVPLSSLSSFSGYYYMGERNFLVQVLFNNHSFVFNSVVNGDNIIFYYFDNFWIKEVKQVNESHYLNPIYEICVQADNYLGFDSTSVVMQLINSYTCLWVLMFLFWHLLYVFLDLFPHLLDRKRYERE